MQSQVPVLSPREEFRHGVGKAVPIMLGYVALAIAYGVLAREAGLTLWETMAMSTFVYAGASQFIATGMFAAAMDPWTIIATTFLVNLRHILMSASLVRYVRKLRFFDLALLGTGITDETFALNSTEYAQRQRHHFFMYGTNLASYLAWNTGSLIGALSGTIVPGLDRLPLDFALPAMFISLLVVQVKDRLLLGTALIAGALSITGAMLVEGNWNIILATILAASIATGWERWKRSGSS
ncbi:MAG: AzlC family ABC transporter permease [Bacillota bacterium]